MGETRKKRRLHARILRRLKHLGVFVLVVLAIYQTAGRLLMPQLGRQVVGIETQLSQLLGATVTIGELRGGWFGFGPTLEIRKLALNSGADGPQQHVDHVTLDLNVLDSLLQRRAAIDSIYVGGLELVLQQDPSGRWTLAGLAASNSPDYTQQILDFVLQTRGISLTDAQLRLQRADGRVATLESLHLDLRNRGRRHDLQSSVRINGQREATELNLSMEGDPRAVFIASLYADAQALELAPLLGADAIAGWDLQSLNIGGRLWLDADQNGVQMLRASVDAVSAGARHAETQLRLSLERAAFSAQARLAEPGVLDIAITDLTFDWQQVSRSIPALQLRVATEASPAVTLRVAELDVALLQQLALSIPTLPENVSPILTTLNPRGTLNKVQFDTALDGSWPGGFTLQANLVDIAADAWGAAPAGSGLDGYLHLQAREGFVELDSDDVQLHFPRLFNEAWRYDHLNARVSWQVDAGGFRVGSSAIDLLSATPGASLDGSVRFDLYNTRDGAGQRVSEIALLVGMNSMDVGLRSAYLPTLPRLRPTMAWLQDALQGGRIHDSGLLLRTSTIPNGLPTNTFATWYRVDDGRLQFQPGWPPLEDIAAEVVVHDGNVVVQAQQATIAGIALDRATATVAPQAAGGSLLTVRGTANTDTATGFAFLRESPVHEAIGSFIDNWEASGEVGVDIALDIPLGARAKERQDERIIDVKVLTSGSELLLPDYALTLSDINGLVNYHSATGLAATAIEARLFDFPVAVGIETQGDASSARHTRITSSGQAAVSALRDWQRQPEFVRNLLGYMGGELGYTATVDILHRVDSDGVRTRLSLASDLVGMRSDLPRPFTKLPAEAIPLELELSFNTSGQVLAARYDDFVSGRIVLDADGIERGQLYFGERNRDFNVRQSDESTPGLLLLGDLPYFNYEEWMTLTDELSARATTQARPLAEYLRLVDMKFGTLNIIGQDLQDISVQVQVDDRGWQIQGTNAFLGGNFTIPMASTPWTVNLDYLRFPPREEPELDANGKLVEEEKVDVLEAVDPTVLPPFDFSVSELSVGDQNLGTFDFRLRPNRNGAKISDFRMQAEDSSISDLALTGGATLDWHYARGVHDSTFNGQFAATNLALVLPRWGHAANVESTQASFAGMLQWSGSPLAFALRDTSGQLKLDIRDGRFIDIQPGTARVFGALNFEALVRRLQLDFSDIFESGYNFDTITGDLALDVGVVTTTGPVIIDGPSSRISINGEIDLAQETIAADMNVQIPLGQNISLLAGLLVSWPVAISTYVASLIFAEEVADFATIIYRLDGPWDNPSAAFEAPGAGAAGPPPATEEP
ncbi:MAG: hypothetical protein RLZZ227_2199 [Pseudomonadota bacterium]|jgi:uncharacterized protein (TIGR02099 family)